MRDSIIYKRQKPLIEKYIQNPKEAWITDYAKVESSDFKNPLNTSLILNDETKNEMPIGLHRAIGGLHDKANPGDVLCGALASCFESTLRMIANRLGVELVETTVIAKAQADVRGTLQIDKNVPVGFQKMILEVTISAKENTKPHLLISLLKGTEYSCVVYQTLKKGVPIEIKTKIKNSKPHIEDA